MMIPPRCRSSSSSSSNVQSLFLSSLAAIILYCRIRACSRPSKAQSEIVQAAAAAQARITCLSCRHCCCARALLIDARSWHLYSLIILKSRLLSLNWIFGYTTYTYIYRSSRDNSRDYIYTIERAMCGSRSSCNKTRAQCRPRLGYIDV